MGLRYFPAAREDIKKALRWSAENFGSQAAQRYKALIRVAVAEINANPNLLHSYELAGLQPGIRLYHLKHSRNHPALGGEAVKNPRHFVAYTVLKADTVIVRLLHERMEIERHLGSNLLI